MTTPSLDSRGLPLGYNFKPEWEVTPREVRRMLSEGKPFILLDCRRLDEHQVARINGSTLMPLDTIEKRAGELEDDSGSKSTPIIVHCHHGVRSLKATAALRAMGFTDVKSMAGGIDLWAVDVDPGVLRY
jgi:adenylyltransferase/sulfurtransferase